MYLKFDMNCMSRKVLSAARSPLIIPVVASTTPTMPSNFCRNDNSVFIFTMNFCTFRISMRVFTIVIVSLAS